MKLLFINVAINWGSTGMIVEGIGSLALANGWEVFVAHGTRYKNSSALNGIQVSSKTGEVLHYVLSSLFDAQGLGSYWSTKRFLKKVESIKPDLVHIHNIHGCFLNYPLLFKYLKAKGIPVVWTLHDCWAFTGHCAHFLRTDCYKWKTGCANCPQLRDFPACFFLDMSKRNYLLKKRLFTSLDRIRIVTVSSWLKNVASHSFFTSCPISVIPNGVNTDVFRPIKGDIRERFCLKGKKILLGVASGFGQRKGLNDYIALADLLSSQFQLILVGVSASDKEILPDSVIAVERVVGRSELAAFYTSADVLLSLSYEETFGLTILEAMACGTPAIVYDNTAQPELISDETGRVVPTGCLSAVVKAIEEICKRDRNEYVPICREHALQYDEVRCYMKYLDIYNSMLDIL